MAPKFHDYVLSHVVNCCIQTILIARFPMFTQVVSDPVLEAHEAAGKSYEIECGAFYSRAIGRGGQTQCTSYSWPNTCWDTVQKVNTRTCGLEGAYASTGDTFSEFAMYSEILVTTIILFVAAGLALILLIFAYRDARYTLLQLSMLAQLCAGLAAVALCHVSATAIDAATYKDNNNVAQKVFVDAGLVAAVTLPVIELMLSNTVTVWDKPHSK